MSDGGCEGETEGPTVDVGVGIAVGAGVGVLVCVADQLAIAVLGPTRTIVFEEEELPEAPPLHPVKTY